MMDSVFEILVEYLATNEFRCLASVNTALYIISTLSVVCKSYWKCKVATLLGSRVDDPTADLGMKTHKVLTSGLSAIVLDPKVSNICLTFMDPKQLNVSDMLNNACKYGVLELAMRLVTYHNADIRDCFAITMAAAGGHISLVSYFMSLNNVDLNARNGMVLTSAARSNQVEVMKLILPVVDPAIASNAAIHAAVKAGAIDAAKFLLKDGRIDPSGDSLSLLSRSFTDKRYEISSLLLTDKRVIGSSSLRSVLESCMSSGNVEAIRVFLKAPRLGRSIINDTLLITAISAGKPKIVRELLKDKRVNTLEIVCSKRTDAILLCASDKGNDGVFKILSPYLLYCTEKGFSSILDSACRRGCVNIVRMITQSRRRYCCWKPASALVLSIEANSPECVKIILDYKLGNPPFNYDYALCIACYYGYEEIIKLLLADGRGDPNTYDILKRACQSESTNILRLLLGDKRTRPEIGCNKLIRDAAATGKHEIVSVLLSNPRVDPSAWLNEAIVSAVINNHHKVVELLLKDLRVDPSCNDNRLIKVACSCGYTEIVKHLLTRPEVDIHVCNDFPMRIANKHGHTAVAKLLTDKILFET